MAKKVVSTFKAGDARNLVKVIKMVKSSKTGHYVFKEDIINKEYVNNFFAGEK